MKSFQPFDYEEQIKEEDRQKRLFLKRIDIAVRDAGVVARWGDGNAGWLIDEFIAACARHKLYTPTQPSPKGKAPIPNSLRKQVFERDKYRCVACETHINLSVDHIYPESLGGDTALYNLQTLCISCNLRKGAKVLDKGNAQ